MRFSHGVMPTAIKGYRGYSGIGIGVEQIGDWKIGPYKERKRLMRSLCKKAGVKYFRFHALRHFGASLLEQSNIPIGSIQRILGHENRTTTELYLHSIGDGERRAMDVLDNRYAEFSHTDSHTKKKDSQAETCKSLIIIGTPGGIRTPGLRIRSPALYPAELRAHN